MARKNGDEIQGRHTIQDLGNMGLRTTLENILEILRRGRCVDAHNGLQHCDTVLETVAATPEIEHALCNRGKITLGARGLEAKKSGDRRRICQKLEFCGGDVSCGEGLADKRELARVAKAETGHERQGVRRKACSRGVFGGESRGVGVQWHGGELENYTATLDGLDDVVWALCNENKARLMGVELQNAAKSLLGYLGKIRFLGIVKQNPCDSTVLRLLAADELREALSDGGDTTVICA